MNIHGRAFEMQQGLEILKCTLISTNLGDTVRVRLGCWLAFLSYSIPRMLEAHTFHTEFIEPSYSG